MQTRFEQPGGTMGSPSVGKMIDGDGLSENARAFRVINVTDVRYGRKLLEHIKLQIKPRIKLHIELHIALHIKLHEFLAGNIQRCG